MEKFLNSLNKLPKEKMVLFDIDYTIFDTALYRDNLYQFLAVHTNIRKNTLLTIGNDIYKYINDKYGYFHPIFFSRELEKKIKDKSIHGILKKAIWNKNYFEESLYDEVEDVMEKLSREASIGIFSKGNALFQRAKLSAIKNFLKKSHVHITVNKEVTLPKIIDLYEKYMLFLVDDALPLLFKAKKTNKNIFVIWVKRGRYASIQEPIAGFKPDAIVPDLSKIVSIVKKN